MTIQSMTGFARAEGQTDGLTWVWEIKSVNGRALDMRFRLPPGLDALEPPLRASLAQRLKRGAVSAALTVARATRGTGIRINRDALAAVLSIAREIAGDVETVPPSLDGLLAIKGVIETDEGPEDESQREQRQAALLAGWEEALGRLAAVRLAEGARLEPVLAARLKEITDLVAEAEASAAAQPEALRARMKAQIADLLQASPALSEERLAQEAALIAAKADVREELDRLSAHVGAARALLAEGDAIGRRFDFLCQEFNREANTLCSKSADIGLTRIGLALKAAIEQLREQVQNIE
ncbi:MAG TPA: YicC/YloC family endoribonuclease [Stellaceae bacterium]|nr:YicC/YloC family endoribonuclease [Stellaceae bacterium]